PNVAGEADGRAGPLCSAWTSSYSRADGPEHGRARSLPPGVRTQWVITLFYEDRHCGESRKSVEPRRGRSDGWIVLRHAGGWDPWRSGQQDEITERVAAAAERSQCWRGGAQAPEHKRYPH